MRRECFLGLALSGLGFGLFGCASNQARYVYQDRESGVVAIAQNTPKAMLNAKKLMNEHFPNENYEIVRAVEVDTGGTRATYAAESGDLSVGSSKGINGTILSGLSLGHKADRRQADSLKLVECRIVYRKKNALMADKLAFSDNPEFTPQVYTDQVVEAVLSAHDTRHEVAKSEAPKRDPKLVPTAGEFSPPELPKLGGK